MSVNQIRSTQDDRIAGGVRIGLGVVFIMAGVMKIVVPTMGAAFAGQLEAIGIPFQELNRWVVPFVEIGVGTALLVGFYTRVVALAAFGIMIVAVYTHVVVDDPTLFPLQPKEPIVPAIVMILAVYLLFRGGGARSLDLKALRRSP